jgi:hypothetical protein
MPSHGWPGHTSVVQSLPTESCVTNAETLLETKDSNHAAGPAPSAPRFGRALFTPSNSETIPQLKTVAHQRVNRIRKTS